MTKNTMWRIAQYGIAAVGISVALGACAPVMDAITATPVANTPVPPTGDLLDTALGGVETMAYAIPGVGVAVGFLVRFIRNRRRAASLGTTAQAVKTGVTSAATSAKEFTINIFNNAKEK